MHEVRTLKEEVETLTRMRNSIESSIGAQSRYSEVSKAIKAEGLGEKGTRPLKVRD